MQLDNSEKKYNWPIKFEKKIQLTDKKRNAVNSNEIPLDLA